MLAVETRERMSLRITLIWIINGMLFNDTLTYETSVKTGNERAGKIVY